MSAFSGPSAARKEPLHLPLIGTGGGRAPLAGEVRQQDRVRPIYAVWEITRRCDLACHHCGTRAGHARSDELDTAECLDLVAQMAELGIKEVTLIGGEAYLRPDWLSIVAAIRAHGMDCTMTTGGRGITRERAEQAAAAGLQSAPPRLPTEGSISRLRRAAAAELQKNRTQARPMTPATRMPAATTRTRDNRPRQPSLSA